MSNSPKAIPSDEERLRFDAVADLIDVKDLVPFPQNRAPRQDRRTFNFIFGRGWTTTIMLFSGQTRKTFGGLQKRFCTDLMSG